MAALDSWQYGDPAKVLERKEAISCKGCKHEEWLVIHVIPFRYCAKGRKYGTKCARYKEQN